MRWTWTRGARPLRGVLGVLLAVGAVLPMRAAASEHVSVVRHDGTAYGRDLAPRASVARKFYETHADAYDFLVVLPTFNVDLGQEAAGLHNVVRNAVQGIGLPAHDLGAQFGSTARLKGYVDVRALTPDAQGTTLESAAAIVAHEVAHQWSGRVAYLDPVTKARRTDLLGREGAHWSFFLDSDASVLYGSDWTQVAVGSFSSAHSRLRYSSLDLYLMGLLAPDEVGPLTLLTPGAQVSYGAEDVPPADGTRIDATARTLSILDVIAAEGARVPAMAQSQKSFRAAFILLTAPGQEATPQQVAFVDALRRSLGNSFFFLTGGRGLLETDLVEVPPSAGSEAPDVARGLAYLLARQQPDGSWADATGTRWRETQAALEALVVSGLAPDVTAASGQGGSFLAAATGVGVDAVSRRVSGLVAARQSPQSIQAARAALEGQLDAWTAGGVGLSRGYAPTLIDTVLAARALAASGATGARLQALTDFLLSKQAADGSWPLLVGGPGSVESTALVLDFLARLPRTPATYAAAGRASGFLEAHRQSGHLYGDERPSSAATAQALLALRAWSRLSSAELGATAQALLALQRDDGSWESSVHATAWALQAVRMALTPNLSLAPSDVALSASTVVDGEGVLATVSVHNFGGGRAEGVQVRAFDANGTPLGAAQTVASIEAGATASVVLTLDTTGQAGASQVFVVVDAPQVVDETSEDDNRTAVPLVIEPPPALPDVTVAVGSLSTTPGSISRLPSTLTASATLSNLGVTDAGLVEVSLRINGVPVATTTVALAGRSSGPVSLTGNVTSAAGPVSVSLVVDPRNLLAEANEGNNAGAVQVPVTPSIDVAVADLSVSPAQPQQGQDATLSFRVVNAGTVDAPGTTVRLTIESTSGETLATLPSQTVTAPAGGSLTRQVSWRANLAGNLVAKVSAFSGQPVPADDHLADNTATAGFTVEPSTLANLDIPAGGLALSPQRPLQGAQATASVVVRNGGASAAGPFFVDFFMGPVGGTDARFARREVATVAAGGSVTISAPFTADSAAQASVRVELDADQQVQEVDETDNTVVVSFEPVPLADLEVVSADIQPEPAYPRAGVSVPVKVSVLNRGGQDAQDAVVDLYLGATLLGSQTVTLVPAGERAEASFTWPTGTLTGEQRLVAEVNASHSVVESRYDNNRAEKKVRVQDAALALSNPYFSPNGDGVKDVTEVSYRLASASAVNVEVRTEVGALVRTLTAEPATSGNISWDGRDARGLPARDGTYRMVVVAKGAGGDTSLGTLAAVVDTNHSPLEEAGSGAMLEESLQPATDSGLRLRGRLAIAADDSGVYFSGERGSVGSDTQCSFYFQSMDGGLPKRLLPEWSCATRKIGDVYVSPDGRFLAFSESTPGCQLAPAGYSCNQITLFNLATLQFQVVAPSLPDGVVQSIGGAAQSNPFSPDGRQLLFVSIRYVGIYGSGYQKLEITDVDGSHRRAIKGENVYSASERVTEYAFSPDGQSVAMLMEFGLNAQLKYEFGVLRASVAGGTPVFVGYVDHGWASFAQRGNWLMSWLPDDEIAYGMPGELIAVNSVTGQQRALFYNSDFNYFPNGFQSLALSALQQSLYFTYHLGASESRPKQVWSVPVEGGTAKPFYFAPEGASIETIQVSPQGSFLALKLSPGGLRALTSLENLGLRLSVTRKLGAASLTLRGTATDKNFESYDVSVRRFPDGASTVVARAALPVVNGTLAEWTPSAPGTYEVTVTARDKAGNVRQRSTLAAWSSTPLLANLWREPEFISPNGDGVQDVSELRYTNTAPLTTQLEFVSTAGTAVRHVPLTHTQGGDQTFTWDGRDDQAQVVADGAYTARMEGASLRFVVDTTPPDLEFRYSKTLEPAENPRDDDVFVQGFTTALAQPEGVPVKVPETQLRTSWQVDDANLVGWALEQRAPASVNEFAAVAEGEATLSQTSVKVEDRRLRLRTLAGRALRLKAWDRAGNERTTPPAPPPEALYITALGEAADVGPEHGYLMLDGRQVPRIDRLTPLVGLDGLPHVFAFQPQQYAFALDHSSDSPLVSFAVRHTRRETGESSVDMQNVSALGDAVVLWDARALPPGGYDVELLATAADGQVFNGKVRFEPKLSEVKVCTTPSGAGESSRVAVTLFPAASFVLERGSVVDFIAPGSQTPEQTFAFNVAAMPEPQSDGTAQLVDSFDTSDLTGCNYRVRFRGRTILGQRLDTEKSVNLCGSFVTQATVTGGGAVLSLAETFRKPISSMEVFVRGRGDWRRVGTLGAFNGTAPALGVTGGAGWACSTQHVRVVTYFADGSAPSDSAARNENTCSGDAEFEVSCTRVTVESVARLGGRAPACTQQETQYAVSVSAAAEGGGNVQEIAAWVTPRASTMTTPVLVEPFTAAPNVSTTGTFSSASLLDGRFAVRAQAMDSYGATATDTLDVLSVAVDKQTPSTVVDAPAAQAVVCPVSTRDAQGRERMTFDVRGTISDNLLEGYAVLLGASGQPLEQKASTFYAQPQARTVTGLLTQVDAQALTSGTYDVQLSAWDASGSSYCSPVRTFRYVAGVDISQFAAAKDFVSPDQGGTTLQATLTEDATATVTLASLSGGVEGASLGVIYEGAFVAGDNTVTWDGRGPAGSPLVDGDYVLRLTARNVCGTEVSRTTRVRVDAQQPVARIDSPTGGSVQGTVSVSGEASDTNFLDYELSVGEGAAPTQFTRVQAASVPSTGVLGTVDTARLQPGLHVLRLVVRDTAGHVSTAEVTVDVQARALLGGFALVSHVLSPNGDGAQDVTEARFRLLAAATVRLEVVDGGGQVVGLPLASVSRDAGEHTAPLELALLQPLADGEYRVRLVATAGGTSEDAEAPLTLDRTLPDVAVTAPLAGAVVRANVDVVGHLDDAHLESWTVLHTSPAGTTRTVASGTSPVNGKLVSLTALAEGAHSLTVRATDVAGNVREHVVAFTVDITPPVVAFAAPLDGAALTGLQGLVPVTATLDEPHPRSLTLELLRADGSAPTLLASWSELPGDGTVLRWDVAAEADGDATLVLKLEDAAGNTRESRIAVTLDSTRPVAHISSPRDGVLPAAGTISGTATDDRLAEYRLELSDGTPETATRFVTLMKGTSPVSAGTLATLSAPPADGDYTLRLTVKDRAGNEQVDMAGFHSDRAPPSAPMGLVAQRSAPDEVTLTWTASGDADLVGYRVLRAAGSDPLLPLGTGLVSGTTFVDEDLRPAEYRYAVVAVDAAQLQSPPSGEAMVDLVPPSVALHSPTDGATLSGSVEVRGTAFSQRDFREYRLSVGQGALPSAFTALASNTVATPMGVLGVWDASSASQGGQYTLRLEAEDVSGNVAEARVVVQVDNTAPAAPVFVSADVSDSTADVQWAANTEPDLAGYLLLANGALANASEGVSPGDYRSYLLPPGTLRYVDSGLPDGATTYELYAVDTAGNFSPPSQARTVSVETHAPKAVVVSPVHLSRLTGPVTVSADTQDLDVVQVQLEVRAAGQGTFLPLGPAATHVPYTAALDPAQFASSLLEVRAVATDTHGNVDPAPASVFLYTAPELTAPVVTALADERAVTLSWTDSNAPGHVLGFDVRRAGASLAPVPPRPTATASASSTSVGSPASAYDSNTSTYWMPAGALPQTWEMVFNAPVALEKVTASVTSGTTAQVFVKMQGVWVPVGVPVVSNSSGLSLALPGVWAAEGVRLGFLSAPSSGMRLSEVTAGLARLATAGALSESNLAEALHTYQVAAVGNWGQRTEVMAQARVYRPWLQRSSQRVAAATTRLEGGSDERGTTIDILREGTLVAQVPMPATSFAADVPLQLGENIFTIVARGSAGNRSMESYPVTVTRVSPPSATVTLAAATVSGTDVGLTFSVSGDTTGVAGFEVWRSSGADAAVKVATVGTSARAHTDAHLRNGTYTYTVVAVDAYGFQGTPSNAVSATVGVPPLAPPEGLVVSASPAGETLVVSWTHAAGGASGFHVERALSAAGPFAAITLAPTPDTSLTNRHLVNGTRYYYRVRAVDAGGNSSAPSGTASGVPGDTQAPDAPRLTSPTAPGTPIVLADAVTDVSGTAEPFSWVELYRNGQPVGRTQAGAPEVQQMKKTLALSRRSGPEISPDGRSVAYAYSDSSTAWGVAVQDLETGTLVKRPLPGGINLGTPAFSADGTRLAVHARSADALTHVYLIDIATGATQPLLSQSTGDELDPVWSPDASRVAVFTPDASGNTSLRVVELTTGTVQSLAQEPGMKAWDVLWLRDGRHLVALIDASDGQGYVRRYDTLDGTSVDVFTSSELKSPMALSPSGREVALAATTLDGEETALFLVDVESESHTTRQLPGDGFVERPVFSPDGTRAFFFNGSILYRQDIDTGGLVRLGRLNERIAGWMGDRIVSYPTSSTSSFSVVEFTGSFDFVDVPLDAADNVFVARARDATGLRSDASLPIEVRFEPESIADLTVSAVLQPGMPLATDATHAVVTLTNIGTAEAANPQVAVAVVTAEGSLRPAPVVRLSQTLAPGASAVLLIPIDVTDLSGPQQLRVVADPAHEVPEVDRTNNEVLKPFTVAADFQPVVSVAMDLPSVPVDGQRTATVTVANPGAPLFGEVHVDLVGTDGVVVLPLGAAELLTLPSGEEQHFTSTVSVGTLLAGTYGVRATVWRDGAAVAQGQASLTILPERTATVAVSTTRTRYLTGEMAEVLTEVTSTSRNSLIEGLLSGVTLRDAGGTVVASRSTPLPMLLPGRRETQLTAFTTETLAPGAYTAKAEVKLGTQVLAQAASTFTVEGRPLLTGLVSLSGATGTSQSVRVGQAITTNVVLENRGTAPEPEATVRLLLTRPDGTSVTAATWTLSSLAQGASWTRQHGFSTEGWPPGNHALTLRVERTAGASEVLARFAFQVLDGKAPRLALVNLTEGMFVRDVVSARVRALDDASGVSAVRVDVDGAATTSAAPVSGSVLDGIWGADLAFATEGAHTLVFSAADLAGNDGRVLASTDNPVSVTVIRDTLPPELTLTGVPGEVPVHGPVVPVLSAQDLHLSAVTATLNGEPFASGTAVSTDGVYALHAVATDKAGNTASEVKRFTIDTVPPRVVLGGVEDGAFVNHDVTPTLSVTDLHPGSTPPGVTLNGQPFTPGTTISAEGEYTLLASASDVAGNETEAHLAFAIDRTPPTLQVTGVTSGAVGNTFTIHFTATDAHLDEGSLLATLDAAAFASGGTVSTEGAHTLHVSVSDKAGNTHTETVSFTVVSGDPLMPPFRYAVCSMQETLVYETAQVVGPSPGDKASIAAGVLAYVGNTAFVSGDIVSADYSAVVENATLAGSLYYGQGYNLGQYATVMGSINHVVPAPSFNLCACGYDVYANLTVAAVVNDNAGLALLPGNSTWWVNGAFELDGAQVVLPTGRYHAEHLHLTNGATLSAEPGAKVLIFVDKNVVVEGGSTLGASPSATRPMVVATGANKFEGETVRVENAGDASLMLYVPNADINMSGDTTIYGALFGRSVNLTGSQRVVLKPGPQVSPPPLYCE